MKVRVVDRRGWGTSRYYPEIITIEIEDHCPVCGEQRGTPKERMFYENGETHICDTWVNPCGHQDKYSELIR